MWGKYWLAEEQLVPQEGFCSLLEIHQWVTESSYILYHLTFTFVDYLYIPICVAYLKWMDTITCSQSWDKWLNRWTVLMRKYYKNILLMCCIRSSFVMKLCCFKVIYSVHFNHCFLVHAKFKLVMYSLMMAQLCLNMLE